MTRARRGTGSSARERVGPAQDLDAEIAGSALPALVVDLADVNSKQALMAALHVALKLPAHFGRNWDALADCLGDRHWLPQGGVFIALRHAAEFRRRRPAEWDTLLEILSEAADFWRDRGVALHVRYT